MINIANKVDCCGCNACGDICPKQCIHFDTDNEGFMYPVVDRSACVNCHQCENVCPQLHAEELRKNEYAEPDCYAAAHRNLYIRFDSTSGGVFSACANAIYSKHGFVGGAIMGEDWEVHQFISDNPEDLVRLRSSKYKQSDARGFYKATKDAVLTGRPVLVCGTPCQMAGLRTFLGKDYDNLTIMDFICRGNNSPLAVKKYMEWHEEREGSKIVYLKAKNKELGWHMLTGKLVFKNGKVLYLTRYDDPMTKCYLKTNAFCRPSCYDCKFKGMPRRADITVADCWGAEELFKGPLTGDIGTSLVLVNNAKGRALLDMTRPTLYLQDMPWDVVRKGNVMIDRSLPPSAYPREDVFKILNEQGFQGVLDKYVTQPPQKITLRNRVGRMIRSIREIVSRSRAGTAGRSPFLILRFIKDNGIKRILSGKPKLYRYRKSYIQNQGELILNANFILGSGPLCPHPPFSTHLKIAKGGRMVVNGLFGCSYGAIIEIFSGGELILDGPGGPNIGATIICGNKITIGKGVRIGRHVTIRDNNGGHYLNIPGYKNSMPIEIGEHVWLCEGCTIMPGARIGAGSVISAKAVVRGKIPPNSLVVGDPGKVVMSDVQWKY